MAEFLVETYVSRAEASEDASIVAEFHDAAEQVSALGRPVRLLASIFVPEDELFLHLFRAVSRPALREALTRTGRCCDRVVEAELAPRPPTRQVRIHNKEGE